MRFGKAFVAALLAVVAVLGGSAFAQDASVQAPIYHDRNTTLIRTQAGGYAIYNQRTRFTIAQVNAGATVLPALTGYKYRLLSAKAISVGGAAGATTTVDVLATQATASVKLVAFAQASLTQSTLLADGASGAAILADGASYVQNDVSTGITIGKTGASVTTATHIDLLISYSIEQ